MSILEFVPEFTTVRDKQNVTFDDIWRIYDGQFETIRDYLIKLGDKYYVEDFTGSVSTTLRLTRGYMSNQLFLYRNNVIQWKDIDYKETSYRTIELLFDRKKDDEIKVVIVMSNILKNIDLLDIAPWKSRVSRIREREDGRPSYGIE